MTTEEILAALKSELGELTLMTTGKADRDELSAELTALETRVTAAVTRYNEAYARIEAVEARLRAHLRGNG